MPDYTPHTDDEIEEMLDFLGLESLDDLFSDRSRGSAAGGGTRPRRRMPEPDVMAHIEELAATEIPARAANSSASPAGGHTTTRYRRWCVLSRRDPNSSPLTRLTNPRSPKESSRPCSNSRLSSRGCRECRLPTLLCTTEPHRS